MTAMMEKHGIIAKLSCHMTRRIPYLYLLMMINRKTNLTWITINGMSLLLVNVKTAVFMQRKSNCQQLAVQQLEDDNNDEETFDYSEAVMSYGTSNTISISSDDDQSQEKFDLKIYQRDVFAFGVFK